MIIRFQDHLKNKLFGILENEKIKVIDGDILTESDFTITNQELKLEDVTLLAPTHPSKVVCIGLNYVDHAKEVNLELPEEPLIFIKPSTTVIGTNDLVVYPEQTKKLEYEAELGIVIGKKTRNVSKEKAKDAILGYTIANDMTARDLQFSDGQWTRGKSFDTFCPIGPGIIRNIDPENLDITLHVNGELKQHSNTKNLIFDVEYIVSYVSKVMTLLPGDIIITGTPFGVGPVKPGDEMVVRIEGIGELRNKIVSSEARD
ncbi:fumarylacetoacetate hydrolase family protein [Bacillus norwichensis]|uniref:Fumarylacetoacetate hydrolase family protein n=1 Tax=Bacillus norwichensis TaxID=2762217 RepID=A0ABR8VRY3_9BACI|nr:fumarylacetoacetate hydrolase family protein [Bacillus norwichensis]MBD8007534.1 fumarylacetoacetate hydrolase family protein [Bacillus norwichensis]